MRIMRKDMRKDKKDKYVSYMRILDKKTTSLLSYQWEN